MAISDHAHGTARSFDLPVGRFGADATDFEAFVALCQHATDSSMVPTADRVDSGVPVYDGDRLRKHLESGDRMPVMEELAGCLATGPGVFAISGAFADTDPVDAMTELFMELMRVEAEGDGGGGDHFAAAGANTRVWNAFEKSARADPGVFLDYYSNPLLSLAAESWLGPYFQLSAQVNVVHPGGDSQSPHRDYHLGFQSVDEASRFPRHAHLVSQVITLQGAVAHSDMPLESGPTMYLPHSQRFVGGYLGYQDERFVDYFAANHVQLPLSKGDAVFFNPALHHGAGHNKTGQDGIEPVERVGNLLQISSAMGKPLEQIDTYAIARAIYPMLLDRVTRGMSAGDQLEAAIGASADGYSFPTNLDTDPPLGGMVPQTGQGLLREALDGRWDIERFEAALDAQQLKRR